MLLPVEDNERIRKDIEKTLSWTVSRKVIEF